MVFSSSLNNIECSVRRRIYHFFKYEVKRGPTSGSMRTFLARIKNAAKFSQTLNLITGQDHRNRGKCLSISMGRTIDVPSEVGMGSGTRGHVPPPSFLKSRFQSNFVLVILLMSDAKTTVTIN